MDIIGIDELYEGIDQFIEKHNIVLSGVRHAISQTVNQLGDKVRTNLTATDLNINSPMPEGGTLLEGVKQYMYLKRNDDVSTGVVSILGNRKTNDGTWRLRFFNDLTKEREEKRTGKRLGQIRPRYFFNNALSGIDSIFKSNIDNQIKDSINEINNE